MSSGLVKINCYKYPSAKNLYSKPESCVNKFEFSSKILSCLMQMTISIPNPNSQSVTEDTNEK